MGPLLWTLLLGCAAAKGPGREDEANGDVPKWASAWLACQGPCWSALGRTEGSPPTESTWTLCRFLDGFRECHQRCGPMPLAPLDAAVGSLSIVESGCRAKLVEEKDWVLAWGGCLAACRSVAAVRDALSQAGRATEAVDAEALSGALDRFCTHCVLGCAGEEGEEGSGEGDVATPSASLRV